MNYRLMRPILGTLAAATACFAAAASANPHPGTLVQHLRDSIGRYRDVTVAESEGYGLATGCVSDESNGVMGVHYINGSLLGDAQLDPAHPEALVYEPLPDGSLRLVAAEFITVAEVWDAAHATEPLMPPVLDGQHFFYEGAPNRYRSPPIYELHVWAFARNPNGMFASWNPTLTCEFYVPPA